MLSFSIHGFDGEDDYFKDSIKSFKDAGFTLKLVKNGEYKIFKTYLPKMKELYRDVAKAQLSVCDRQVKEIHLSGENWDSIPTHLGSEYTNLDDYRTSLISHELAHALGYDHVKCRCVGCEQDIRQQPSRHLNGCIPTTKVIISNKSPHTNRNI